MPNPSRPHMPGYDLPSGVDEELLSWDWAEQRLVEARNYWVATSHPDGRPHTMPVWGVWMDTSLVFSTSVQSRKAKNLEADPRCSITTERADEAVIVEGQAAPVSFAAGDEAMLRRWAELYQAKYDWEMDPASDGIYRVEPRVAFGFIEHADRFAVTATRWVFRD